MEKRKLQRTGGTSYTLTLPKDWIEENRLKEKDAVNISFYKNGVLSIHPLGTESAPRRTMDISDMTLDEIIRETIGLYIIGCEEINIVCKDIPRNIRTRIKQVSHTLVGLELSEESSDKLTLKNILGNEKFSLGDSIEMMISMSKSMLVDAMKALFEKDKELARDIIERDDEADKIYFLILRRVQSLLQGNATEEDVGFSIIRASYYEKFATQLERVADHGAKIAALTLGKDFSPPNRNFKKSADEVSGKLIRMLENLPHFINDINKREAHETLRSISSLHKNIDLVYKKLGQNYTAETVIVCDSLHRIGGYISNVAEDAIDQSLLEDLKK